MQQKNKVAVIYGLWFADLLSIILSFVLSTYIRFGNFRDMGDREIHFQVALCILLSCTIYSFFIDWNRDFVRRNIGKELFAIARYEGVLVAVAGFVMFLLKWSDPFSRVVMLIFIPLNFGITLSVHCILKKIYRTHFSSDKSMIKVLLVTQSELLDMTLERLKRELDISYRIVGAACIDDDGKRNTEGDVPIVASAENLIPTATAMALDEVFINAPGIPQSEIDKMIIAFGEMGINCHYNLQRENIQLGSSKLDSFGSYSVITYTRFQKSYKRLLVKRFIDLAGGLVGAAITVLFYPFVAAAIKLESKGPVFFSQLRVGRNGRRFKIYKFRSMYQDAEEKRKELENQNEMRGGYMFKITDDPRITKVGAFLRKTSLDELPQFFNVLRGDMSLVGTRPPTVDEFEKYNQYYRRRISMTPGLTGMWQVSGRSEIDDFDQVVKLDLQYIDSWNLRLDMKILFRTIGVVLFRRGAK